MVQEQAELAVDGFAADATPICYVNGKRYDLPLGRGEGTLLQFLRGRLYHTFQRTSVSAPGTRNGDERLFLRSCVVKRRIACAHAWGMTSTCAVAPSTSATVLCYHKRSPETT